MVRFAVTGAVAALLALTGCGGAQERERKEQQAAAAEKKLADGRAFLEQLEQEKRLLATKLTEANARLAESRGRLRRTLAGAAYLAAEPESGGLVLDVDMGAARDGFLLEEAARAKDHEAVTELAVRVLDDQRPCVRKPTEEAAAEDCPTCEVAPYEDACSGVETHLSSSPDWSCATLARTGEGLPPTAFCTSEFQHPAPAGSVSSDYAEQNLDTSLQVVRVAFAHNGQLHVSDYPAPEPTLYNPPNVGVLARCGAETERNKCIYDCQVSHGRYEDPCACEAPSAAAEPEEEGAIGDGSDVADESPEVARARAAAEAAEEEAEAAREAAEEARKELQYQECLSSCEQGPEDEHEEIDQSSREEEYEPQPTLSEVSVSLESTPAPGIFVVSRKLEVLGPRQQVLESSALTLVLRHPGLVALWKKKAPPDEALGKLEEVGRLDTVPTEAGKAALLALPGVEGSALIGLLKGQVKAYAFNTKPGQDPVAALEPAAACEGVRADPKRFPQGVQEACAKLVPPAATVEVDAGAPESPTDAGAPESPTDAGTQPGEVAP